MKLTFTVCGQSIEYPPHLCENIPLHEARVLGTIVNDLSLMSEIEDKSNLFHTRDGIVYYELLKNMYQHGVVEFDAGAVQSALSRLGEEFKREFIAINGNGYLNAIKRDFSEKNFESHLQGLIEDVQKLEIYRNLYSNLCDMNNNVDITSNNVINMLEDTLENTRDIMEISGTKPIELNIDNNYIQNKVNGVKRGLGYGLYSISKATKGLHLGNVSMLSAFTNVGKALPLTANIYTPKGYVKMQDIKLGDIVYDMDGKQCKVIGVFPQGIKDRYEIIFEDDSKVECCDEHLWVIQHNNANKVEPLKKIIKYYNNNEIVCVPINKPLNATEGDIEYYNSYNIGIYIGRHYVISEEKLNDSGYRFSDLKLNIPKDFFTTSIYQREQLLKGILGYWSEAVYLEGNIELLIASDSMRDDLIHLCHTLGYRVTYTDTNRKNVFRVVIYTNKKQLQIKKINKLTPCEMQCIMVDSPTHTYLTDNMIVTHNTTVNFNEVMLSLLDAGESIFVYSNESTIDDFKDLLLIRTLVKQFKYYQLTRTKLNDLDNIKNNNPELFKEFMIKISEASQYINRTYNGRIILYSVSKYSIAEFNMLMRRYALRGFKYFLIDTMKSEEAGDANAVGKLVQQSRNIYEMARNLNTHVMVSYQIASYLKQNMKRVLDESCLSGSKQIAEILDILICMRELYPDEYTGQKNEVKVFKYVKNPNGNGVTKEYRTLETGKKYLVLFLPKNRYGAKILPTIYEFNGEFGTVSEVGYSNNIQDKSY